MADAEHFAHHLAQSAAQRQVEAIDRGLAHRVGTYALGHHDRGHRVRKPVLVLAEELRPLAVGTPHPHCRTRRLGEAGMAGEHGVEAFLLQHLQ